MVRILRGVVLVARKRQPPPKTIIVKQTKVVKEKSKPDWDEEPLWERFKRGVTFGILFLLGYIPIFMLTGIAPLPVVPLAIGYFYGVFLPEIHGLIARIFD